MRRIITALAVGGVLAGGVFGAAATLGGINSASLGADDAIVLSCDTNGVSVDYATLYVAAGPGPPPIPTSGYRVNQILVSGIADACLTEVMTATLTDSGVSLGSSQNAIYGPGGPGLDDNTATMLIGGGALASPLAEDVDDIHIVVG